MINSYLKKHWPGKNRWYDRTAESDWYSCSVCQSDAGPVNFGNCSNSPLNVELKIFKGARAA